MPGWGWALLAVAAVVVLALVVWQSLASRRTRMLRRRFGSEYDRAVDASDSRRAAESELAARAERRDLLDIRPLSPEARGRYVEDWQLVQARFVDDPAGAVREADVLIQSVMVDRGYPVEEFEQRTADVSVDHPDVVENYREGRRLAGVGGTEELRRAMHCYRALFDELVQPGADAPLARETEPADLPADAEPSRRR
jgi:hypothetical protein